MHVNHNKQNNIIMDFIQRRESALHKAAWRAHKDVVELLVENEADKELRDKVHTYVVNLVQTHRQ